MKGGFWNKNSNFFSPFFLMILLIFINLKFGYNLIYLNFTNFLEINSLNNSVILFLPDNTHDDVLISVEDNNPIKISNIVDRYIYFSYAKFNLSSKYNKTSKIGLWYFPINICDFDSFILRTNFELKLSSTILTNNYSICIFTDPFIKKFDLNIEINSNFQIYDNNFNLENNFGFKKINSNFPYLIVLKQNINNKLLYISFKSISNYFHCNLIPILYYIGLAALHSKLPSNDININIVNQN